MLSVLSLLSAGYGCAKIEHNGTSRDYSSLLNTGKPHPFLQKEWKDRKNAELHIYGQLRTFIDMYVAALEQEADTDGHRHDDALAPEVQSPAVVTGSGAAIQAPNVDSTGGSVTSSNPEKEAAINALINSPNFAETHVSVAALEPLRATLNRTDVERLLRGALENNQIWWIASDSDVYAFFSALLHEHADIDAELLAEATEVFGKASQEE